MGTEGRNMDARRLLRCIAHNTTTDLVRNSLVSKKRMIRGKMTRFSICTHKHQAGKQTGVATRSGGPIRRTLAGKSLLYVY